MTTEEMVTITKKRFEELLEREAYLCALESVGVRKSDYHDEALERLEQWENEAKEQQ